MGGLPLIMLFWQTRPPFRWKLNVGISITKRGTSHNIKHAPSIQFMRGPKLAAVEPSVCVFEGTMNASLYVNILDHFLVPFIDVSPASHRQMQDTQWSQTYLTLCSWSFWREICQVVKDTTGESRCGFYWKLWHISMWLNIGNASTCTVHPHLCDSIYHWSKK